MSNTTQKSNRVVVISEEAADTKASNVKIRCGDCRYFTGGRHPAHSMACKEEGVLGSSTAPSCYSADVSVFRSVGFDTFNTLSTIVSSFTPKQQRVLMGLLRTSSSLERTGFTFMQKVVFCVGEDYIANYMAAFVLQRGVDGAIDLVGSSYLAGDRRSILVASMSPSSLLTLPKFQKRRARLAEKGLVVPPQVRSKASPYLVEGYEPPTLETPIQDLERAAAGKSKSLSQINAERAARRQRQEGESEEAGVFNIL